MKKPFVCHGNGLGDGSLTSIRKGPYAGMLSTPVWFCAVGMSSGIEFRNECYGAIPCY